MVKFRLFDIVEVFVCVYIICSKWINHFFSYTDTLLFKVSNLNTLLHQNMRDKKDMSIFLPICVWNTMN